MVAVVAAVVVVTEIVTVSETLISGMKSTGDVVQLIAIWVARWEYKYPFHALPAGRGGRVFGVGSGGEVVEILILELFAQTHDYLDRCDRDRVLARRVPVAGLPQCFSHGPSPAPSASVPLQQLSRLRSMNRRQLRWPSQA